MAAMHGTKEGSGQFPAAKGMEMPAPLLSRRPSSNKRLLSAVVLTLLSNHLLAAETGAVIDVTQLSLEDILNTEIVSASKKMERANRAPADVTVIQADDIRLFGWRTLADVLRATRGFYITNDYTYEYVGVRGFAPPGDFNSRLLVLVDGNRLNDPVYDTGFIGGELPLDLDLIQRIEIVRGPSSSLYGSNAFFGVVNLITREGRDLQGGEIALQAAEHYIGQSARGTYGRRLDNGLELLLSATHSESDGETLYFPEFDDPATNNGIAHDMDYEDRDQAFLKLDWGRWALTAGHGWRKKGRPNGPAGAEFNQPGTSYLDQESFGELQYRQETASGEFNARVFAGDYQFWGDMVFPGPLLSGDDARGSWYGLELRQGIRLTSQHQLVAGLEYQNNYRQFQTVYDDDPYALYLDREVDTRKLGLYLQDDWTLNERWSATLGLRYDSVTPSYADSQGEFSPRLALIHRPGAESTLKLLYGHAFRAPNIYESQYLYPFDPGRQLDNPDLSAETIDTVEVVWERYFGPETRLTVAGYAYKLKNLIALTALDVANPAPPPATVEAFQLQNQAAINAQGLELELEHQFENRARLRASYTIQHPHPDDHSRLSNVPRHLGKLNLGAPLGRDDLRLGVELQASSRRLADSGDYAPGYAITNLNLHYLTPLPGTELSFSVRNLLEARYYDPAADDGIPGRSRVPQRERELAARLQVRF